MFLHTQVIENPEDQLAEAQKDRSMVDKHYNVYARTIFNKRCCYNGSKIA